MADFLTPQQQGLLAGFGSIMAGAGHSTDRGARLKGLAGAGPAYLQATRAATKDEYQRQLMEQQKLKMQMQRAAFEEQMKMQALQQGAIKQLFPQLFPQLGGAAQQQQQQQPPAQQGVAPGGIAAAFLPGSALPAGRANYATPKAAERASRPAGSTAPVTEGKAMKTAESMWSQDMPRDDMVAMVAMMDPKKGLGDLVKNIMEYKKDAREAGLKVAQHNLQQKKYATGGYRERTETLESGLEQKYESHDYGRTWNKVGAKKYLGELVGVPHESLDPRTGELRMSLVNRRNVLLGLPAQVDIGKAPLNIDKSGLSHEAAGRIVLAQTGAQDIQRVIDDMYRMGEDGRVELIPGRVLGVSARLPRSKGKQIHAGLKRAYLAQLRLITGAAQTTTEDEDAADKWAINLLRSPDQIGEQLFMLSDYFRRFNALVALPETHKKQNPYYRSEAGPSRKPDVTKGLQKKYGIPSLPSLR